MIQNARQLMKVIERDLVGKSVEKLVLVVFPLPFRWLQAVEHLEALVAVAIGSPGALKIDKQGNFEQSKGSLLCFWEYLVFSFAMLYVKRSLYYVLRRRHYCGEGASERVLLEATV